MHTQFFTEIQVPVVAPFGALKDYMYKIKITPGKMKRGKCAKAAIASFLLKKDEHTSRLISDIPTQDVINTMLPNSQVAYSSSKKNKNRNKGKKKGRGKKK